MADVYKVYYVPEFPITRITNRGEEGWYHDPHHIRNQYDFLGAIVEHVENTFCEPIQITMRVDKTVVVGPSGVTRLYALTSRRNWTIIPAIVSTSVTPDWLDISTPVTSLKQFRGYYRLAPADIGFELDGRAYHRNHNPHPQQVMESMVVCDSTRQRIILMLQEGTKY